MFWYCVHNTYNHFRVTKIDFLQVSEVLYIFSSERDCLNMSSHWETKNLYRLFSNKQHLLAFWHTLTVSFQICKNAGLVWLLHFDPLIKVRSSVKRCSVKKVFLQFSKNSQPQAWNFIKKRLWRRCFPVNFTKFLRTPFFSEHPWWLRLISASCKVKFCLLENGFSENSWKNLIKTMTMTCTACLLKNVTLKACNFIKKEALAQVFSCEFCKISKNIWATDSGGYTF